MSERYTFFLDIDGCIFPHHGGNAKILAEKQRPLLNEVEEFCKLCGKQGHKIILTSGRREGLRRITEKQLQKAGIDYDQLILGCSNAIRVLVNDTKPYREDEPQTAIAFNIERDKGLGELVEFLEKNK